MEPSFLPLWLSGLGVMLAALTLLWLVSIPLSDVSIVDPAWGLTFAVQGTVWFTLGADGGRASLALGLVWVWALRLGLYLLWRRQGHGEDFRYQEFRRRFGPERYWWLSLFQVFWLQGGLSGLVGLTLLGAMMGDAPLGWLDALGVAVWAFGFVFEAGGDWQLARFKADPANKGKLLTTGLWRYTRHPNYFGDACQWWGLALLCVAAGTPVAALGAVLMTWLIVKVSGVALLERSLERVKPGYEDYTARTSAFVPWPPRSG
ncbi:DUF1295 domain-containing protein [Myxococcota bacterium]|nr:DUF1295 domain-containing protein [Myxococcota bacterium]